MLRTRTCREPRTEDCGQQVTLVGEVHSRRDHGLILFIDELHLTPLPEVVERLEKEEKE
jgi:aspartyl-tRNA synthetase